MKKFISLMNKIMYLFIAVLTLGLLVAQAAATPITLNLSTGVASWTFEKGDYTSVTNQPAQVVVPGDADWGVGGPGPGTGWAANGPNSDWIAVNPSSSSGNNGIYFTIFNLAGYNLSTVSFTDLAWTIDDEGTLLLNGNQLASLGAGNWPSLWGFTIPSNDLVQGVNTLTIQGGLTDNLDEGVRLEGSLTASPSETPEPSSLALLGTGLVVVMGAIRRKLLGT